MNFYDILTDSLRTSYIDKNLKSEENYTSKLIYNDLNRATNVLSNIQTELKNCEEFWFSIAFITSSGLITLKSELKDLEERGIRGKILTTNYLYFSTPNAFRDLLKFKNIEIRVLEDDFHIKGYMFKRDDFRRFMIGSSNLTQNALKKNKEWNLLITSSEYGKLIEDIENEFNIMWNNAVKMDCEWINRYSEEFYSINKKRVQAKTITEKTKEISPNIMQKEALKSLKEIRGEGKDRALLISATGTGKTYLSAFDIKSFSPKKVLFIAHREKILKQAEDSFKKILGRDIKSGIISGNSKDYSADYIFSTVNMMRKNYILDNFSKDEFDYIVIDETHRAAADSYRIILDYFNPKFFLGMTATPERLDGKSVFELFDYNIAYEIRLEDALREDILCPFHYFGITDIYKDNKSIDLEEFKNIKLDSRVNFIIKQIEYYGYSGDRQRGLIFCSTIEEAEAISKKFNERKYRTLALSGKDSIDKREEAIRRLEMKEDEEALDYIFSVDIFNEGVDIPSLNQIIMLRPTQSPIIFVQQLGRGLRKFKNKNYLVVLDFIANYDNNYMIPIALSGDRTYNKDNLRRFVAEGNKIIPGVSTINFDEIAKKKIYESLESARFNDIKFLKDKYQGLKEKVGSIPSISDFEKYNTIDISKYFHKFFSYYNFLKKYEKDYDIRFNGIEEEYIEYFSRKIANGKRIDEILILEIIIRNFKNGIEDYNLKKIFKDELLKRYGIELDIKQELSVFKYLTNKFLEKGPRSKYKNAIYLEGNIDRYGPNKNFLEALENENFLNHFIELIDYSINTYEKMYSNRYKNTNFELYKKYDYEDVCRLLNWEKNLNGGIIGGYKYDEYTNTFPVFINYHKSEDCINYDDRFESKKILKAISKSNKTIKSKDAERIYTAKDRNTKIHLFVRKDKEDKEMSKEFYFLGEMEPIGDPLDVKVGEKSAFEITYLLEDAVREDIYDYITEVSLND
ncbi:MAG: DEAD/DEAH box helicase [Andreesenia angusta]|nr:DEAD/DEAH box helicase [Andreesenia angusta]